MDGTGQGCSVLATAATRNTGKDARGRVADAGKDAYATIHTANR